MLKKGVLALFLTVNMFVLFSEGYSQNETKDEDSKYYQQFNPASLIKRLSYENLRNIRLLKAAIINFGGGETEVQKLIDQYADATTLYFSDKIEEAAAKFAENEREIFNAAKKLATDYSTDSSQFLNKSIKRNIEIIMQEDSENKQHRNAVMAKYLDNAKSLQKQANTILNDHKNVGEKNTPSARRLITSINYYRLSKENLFMMYETYISDMELDKDKAKDKEMKEQLFDKMINEDYKADYKKDMQDNKNQVYTENKENTEKETK
ncbi:MAG: hypothetical protein FWH53_03210 [Leptospirales bacterium]|nr:hypothetical protein [Leptospirales bacterium]